MVRTRPNAIAAYLFFIKFTVPFDENAGAFQTVLCFQNASGTMAFLKALNAFQRFGSSFDDLTIREKCVGPVKEKRKKCDCVFYEKFSEGWIERSSRTTKPSASGRRFKSSRPFSSPRAKTVVLKASPVRELSERMVTAVRPLS